MSPTLQDIARRARVTPKTVSNVLNGRNKEVRPTAIARAKRIRQLADRMGYRVNASARATRSGSFQAVTLLLGVKSGRSTLPTAMLEGIHDALAEQDYSMSLVRMLDEELSDDRLVPRLLRERSGDGLLIDYTHDLPPRMAELIERHRIPAIWLNTKRQRDCVYCDDQRMGRWATEQILLAGHRRIAYVHWGAGWSDLERAHYSEHDRQAGYEQAMTAAGLAPNALRRQRGDVWEDPVAAVRQLLDQPSRPTAILVYGSETAQWVAWAARDAGLAVPADLSLVALGPRRIPLANGRWVTVLPTPDAEVGRIGVGALLSQLRTGRSAPPRAVLPQDGFAEGNTLSPPSAEAGH